MLPLPKAGPQVKGGSLKPEGKRSVHRRPSLDDDARIDIVSVATLAQAHSVRSRGENDIVARLLDFWRAFVVDSMVSDLFSFIFFVFPTLA